MPLTSIIIPTYNRAHLIGDALRSVLEQTVADYEIIVIDDGSTDGTAEILAQFGERIRYLGLPHSGLPGLARNAGIRIANGSYVAFLDADDLWVRDALARRLDYLDRHPEAGMVYADTWWFEDATGRHVQRWHELITPASGWIGPHLLRGDCIPTSTVLVRRAVLDDVGLFDEQPRFRGVEDWELWLRIAARYQIALMAKPLARMRMHAGSMTGQRNLLDQHRDHLATIERACAVAPDVYGPVRLEAVTIEVNRAMLGLIAHGRARDAQQVFAQAQRREPATTRALLDMMRTMRE